MERTYTNGKLEQNDWFSKDGDAVLDKYGEIETMTTGGDLPSCMNKTISKYGTDIINIRKSINLLVMFSKFCRLIDYYVHWLRIRLFSCLVMSLCSLSFSLSTFWPMCRKHTFIKNFLFLFKRSLILQNVARISFRTQSTPI